MLREATPLGSIYNTGILYRTVTKSERILSGDLEIQSPRVGVCSYLETAQLYGTDDPVLCPFRPPRVAP